MPWSAWVSVTWDLAIACGDANISCLDYCSSCLFIWLHFTLRWNKVISIPAWLCIGSLLTLQPHLPLHFPLFPLINYSVFFSVSAFSSIFFSPGDSVPVCDLIWNTLPPLPPPLSWQQLKQCFSSTVFLAFRVTSYALLYKLLRLWPFPMYLLL